LPSNGADQAQTVELLRCIECAAEWRKDSSARWRAYLTDSRPPEIAVYCSDCAEREFGGEPVG
jgi:hypothetical protein